MAGGSLKKLSYNVATNILEEVTKQSQGSHTRDIEVDKNSPTTSFINKEQRKRDE